MRVHITCGLAIFLLLVWTMIRRTFISTDDAPEASKVTVIDEVPQTSSDDASKSD